MMKKNYLLACLLALGLAVAPAQAEVKDLLPQPQQLTLDADGTAFTLGQDVTVNDETGCVVLDAFLEETGSTKTAGAAATINVTLVDTIDGAYDYELSGYENEAYALTVSGQTINISAVTKTGVIRAAQTLVQLAEGDGVTSIPALTIVDWPAFKLRGYMHDVGRSFITFDELKYQIDLFSRFKVNTFHWHLTENQAWRFEVKQYPQLTEASSMTRFAGSYYTQEQCQELEEYAAERGVIVIPEIDMPGHSEAFTRAMGHSMQTDEGVEELKNILTEVAAVFTRAPYIHIGADEQTITYTDFLSIITSHVHSLGKLVVVWNPIRGVTISKSAGVDMTQMWSTSGSQISGMPNIDCRYNYVNHFDLFADVVGIYKSNIYYAQQGSANVAGTITAVWNDRKTPTQEDIIRQNNLYANTLASADRAWKGGGKQYIEVGGTTLPNSGDEFTEFEDWETRFLFHKAHSLKNEPIPYVKQTNVRWRITDAFPNGGDATLKLPPETEGLKESYTYNGTTYNTAMATGAGIYLRHTWGSTIPTFFDNPQTNTTAYAWTYVYSPTARTVGALIEFQNYGRSEKDTAPDAGKWDRKGSMLYVNDEEIAPPTWDNTGVTITNEVDLMNENCTARKPTEINLKEGWNKVLMKLPYNPTSGVRLTKWMFTFVLTDLEGNDALSDVIYSPGQYIDEEAEALAGIISDARTQINEYIGTDPGYYDASLAADLEATLDSVEATLGTEMTDEERQAQKELLNAAVAEFEADIAAASPIMPKVSSNGTAYSYLLCTPLRNGRYVTGNGNGSAATGTTSTTSKRTHWRFIERTDGTYDIQCAYDSCYLSPASSYNTAIYTRTARPSAGWTLTSAGTGYFIITSSTVQLNQTTSALSYQLYNWGSGTNTTDTGCRFVITYISEETEEVTLPTPLLTVCDLELDGTAPWQVPEPYATQILSAPALTIVMDYTMATSAEVTAYAAACDTTSDSGYSSLVTIGGTRYGIRYDDSGGHYTTSATCTGSHQVVFAFDNTNTKYRDYFDGSFGRDETGMSSIHDFYSVTGKNAVFLGGLKVASNSNKYPMTGTIHSARFYTTALSDDQVALLTYDNLESDINTSIAAITVDAAQSGNIFTLDGRRVTTEDVRQLPKGLYIMDGKKVLR